MCFILEHLVELGLECWVWWIKQEGVDGVYRESWFTQIRLPSVMKTLKIYSEAWGKNTVDIFITLFKDLTLKYQNVTVKMPKCLPFTDFQAPPFI